MKDRMGNEHSEKDGRFVSKGNGGEKGRKEPSAKEKEAVKKEKMESLYDSEKGGVSAVREKEARKDLADMKKTDMYDFLIGRYNFPDEESILESLMGDGDELVVLEKDGVKIFSYYSNNEDVEYHVDENNEEWGLDEDGQFYKK